MKNIVATNRTDPSRMTPAERLDEVAMILAAATLRLWAKHVSASEKREISRDNCLDDPRETRPTAVDL